MTFRVAVVYAFSTRYLALVLQFLATIALARLLTPEDIGIYSVGAAVIMIAHTLRDFGTSTYVIQERNLTQSRLGTAFSITILAAWSLAIALWLAAGPIAGFYAEARVQKVLQILAINFILIPFGSIGVALLRRAMDFRAIMYITVVSTIMQSGITVLLAFFGVGFVSLAWGGVFGTLATVLGAWIANPHAFFFKPTMADRSHVLAFSVRSSISSIGAEASNSAPDMVLGRTVGMEGTGLFSRAMGYVQLFERLLQDVLRSVMLPYLSEVERAGGDVVEKLRLVVHNVVAVSLFIIGLTAVLAQPLIVLLYGNQWGSAVPLAQVLCIAMAIRCAGPTLAAALVAGGQVNLVMRTTLISTSLKFILLIVASRHGLLEGAIGYVFAEIGNVASLLYFCGRSGRFTWVKFLRIYLKNLPLAIVGVSPAVAMLLLLQLPEKTWELFVYLLAAGGGSLIAWLLAVWASGSPLKSELALLLAKVRRKTV